MSKRYVLQRDLPDVKGAKVFCKHPSGNLYITERNYNFLMQNPHTCNIGYPDDPRYHENIVEKDDGTWFLPEQPEVENKDVFTTGDKIALANEIINDYEKYGNLSANTYYHMRDIIKKSKQPLKPDTKEAIKSAIEVLVNNGYEVVKVDSANNSQHTYHPYKYTQQQLDEAIQKAEENTWNFAREKMIVDGKPTERQYRFLSFHHYKDYLKNNETLYQQSLQSNTNTKTSKHWT